MAPTSGQPSVPPPNFYRRWKVQNSSLIFESSLRLSGFETNQHIWKLKRAFRVSVIVLSPSKCDAGCSPNYESKAVRYKIVPWWTGRECHLFYTVNYKNVTFYFWLWLWLIWTDFYSFCIVLIAKKILHATIIKFITLPDRYMCAPIPGKIKTYILLWFIKRRGVHLTATLTETDFNNFWIAEAEKMYKTEHSFTYLLVKESACC